MSKQPKLSVRAFFVGLCGTDDYGADIWNADQRLYMQIAYGRTHKEAARRAEKNLLKLAAKLRKVAAEFEKIVEEGK